jgi:hypothetical protein
MAKPRPDRSKGRSLDLLSASGMSVLEQHAAVMRAAAVPASDFEGKYPSQGSYTSKGAQLLQRKTWESRMRNEMGK